MEKHTFGKEYGFQTRAVHTGNDVDAETGAIKRPITMANSYALPYDPSDLNWSSAGKNLYTRNGGSNQQYLQEKLASLEGGEDCIVLASGVAALSGLFFALLESGDHVVFSSVTYIAVYRLLHELLKNKFHVDTTIVDGKILLRNGRYTQLDDDAVFPKLQATERALAERIIPKSWA